MNWFSTSGDVFDSRVHEYKINTSNTMPRITAAMYARIPTMASKDRVSFVMLPFHLFLALYDATLYRGAAFNSSGDRFTRIISEFAVFTRLYDNNAAGVSLTGRILHYGGYGCILECTDPSQCVKITRPWGNTGSMLCEFAIGMMLGTTSCAAMTPTGLFAFTGRVINESKRHDCHIVIFLFMYVYSHMYRRNGNSLGERVQPAVLMRRHGDAIPPRRRYCGGTR